MRRISILLLAGLVSFTACCGLIKSFEPRYGREYNDERKEVGLPIIPSDWEPNRVNQESCVWVNPEGAEKEDHHIPVHLSKRVNYHTGTLISETDVYYGREDYTVLDEGTFREKLSITYHYREDPRDYQPRLGWEVLLQNKDAVSGVEISLEEAEEILAEWGIERLSYEFPAQ